MERRGKRMAFPHTKRQTKECKKEKNVKFPGKTGKKNSKNNSLKGS